MMKANRNLLLLPKALLLAASYLVVGAAFAGPFPFNVATDVYGVAQGGVVNGIPTANDDNDPGPDINDAVNLLTGSGFGRNTDVDPLLIGGGADTVWQDIGGGGTIALIGLSAGFNNTVGIYTDLGVGATQTPLLGPFSGATLHAGTAADPFPGAVLGLAAGTDFGWYLSANGVTDYFSEPTLNPAGFDHMMTFDLPGANGTDVWVDFGLGATKTRLNDPYLIAWEDLPFSNGKLGDDDYDDMMYIVDFVRPVPEPATLVLLGLGLLGLGFAKRRQ